VRRALVAAGALAAAGAWLLLPRYGAEPALPGRVVARSLDFGGHARSYLAYLPSRLAPSPDLVFVLHGSMSTGAQMRRLTGYSFDPLAERDGAVVVYPDGYAGHWNDCRRAASYAANSENVDDVGFLRAVADALAREQGVAWGHVFASGFSNGGQLALRLALEAPDWITAAAPVAANLPTDANLDCAKSGRPVSFLLINGSEDPMNPHRGGDAALYGVFASRGPVLSTRDTIRYFTELAGYRGEPAIEPYNDLDQDDGTHALRRLWMERGKALVAVDIVTGGGHTWPHPRARLPRLLGRTSRDFDAADVIWRFFADARAEAERAAQAAR